MSERLHNIEDELQRMEAEIYAAATEYRDLARDAAEKRADYDVEYAKAMLTIINSADTIGKKLTAPEKEALAVKKVEGELTEARIAEGIAEGAKRHLDALQTIISSIQTRSKLIQTERSLTARQV